MPELPEVETIRRQLSKRVCGRRVVDAGAFPSVRFDDASKVVGCTFTTVGRRGKYLLIGTDDSCELVLHLGMTGTISVDPPTSEPAGRPERWLRAWWSFDDGTSLRFCDMRRFGRVAVVPTGDHRALPTLDRLGPEPLSDAFSAAGLQRALGQSQRAVKTQLLGQRVVAGVGNIYADEALWRSGIAPTATRIGRVRAERLHGALVAVLREAIEHGGTRLRDYRSVEGDTGAHQFHLDCYGRAGEPCTRCGSALRHRTLDGRGTTWCPRCQLR